MWKWRNVLIRRIPVYWLLIFVLPLSSYVPDGQYAIDSPGRMVVRDKPVTGAKVIAGRGSDRENFDRSTPGWRGSDRSGLGRGELDRIRLQTLDRRIYKLSSLHKKLLAITFLSPECPLCQNYTLVLNKLQARFGKDLDITGVFPGKSTAVAECRAFREKYHIQFPLLTDAPKNLVKKLGARITPEVFLLDQEGNILYQGAIDNWVAALGKQRARATENYLEDGVADYLNGEPIKVKEAKPIGCFINE